MRTPLYVYFSGSAALVMPLWVFATELLPLWSCVALAALAGVLDGIVTHIGMRRMYLIIRAVNPLGPSSAFWFAYALIFFVGTLTLFFAPTDSFLRPLAMLLISASGVSKTVELILNRRYFKDAPRLVGDELLIAKRLREELASRFSSTASPHDTGMHD